MGSYYDIPKVIFYLLKGDYITIQGFKFPSLLQREVCKDSNIGCYSPKALRIQVLKNGVLGPKYYNLNGICCQKASCLSGIFTWQSVP